MPVDIGIGPQIGVAKSPGALQRLKLRAIKISVLIWQQGIAGIGIDSRTQIRVLFESTYLLGALREHITNGGRGYQ